MGLRTRLSRWLAPDPFEQLARYERSVDPELLALFEEVRAGGGFQRAAAIEVTPSGGSLMGFDPSSGPSATDLLDASISSSDISARAIAQRVSELELQVKFRRRVASGTYEEEILDDHIAKQVFDNPHPTFSMGQLLGLTVHQLLQAGEGHWLKVRNGFAVPAEFQPMIAETVHPVVRKGVVANYTVRDASGRISSYPAREMLRFWLPDPKHLYSARGYLAPNWRNHKGSIFAEEHLAAFYERDATPSAYLQGKEGAKTPNEAARRAFELLWETNNHRRHGRSRAPAMVPPFWEVKESTIQKGSEMVPLLEWWMRLMFMNYGVPASVRGLSVAGDRSTADTNQYVFDRYAVLPVTKIIADTLTRGFTREFDPNLFACFEEFVSEDKDFELRREESDIRNKIRSPQQILRDRGADVEDAPWGEFPPGTLAEVPYLGEEPDEEVDSDLSDFGAPAADAEEEPEEGAEAEPEDTDEEERKRRAHGRIRAAAHPARAWARARRRRRKWAVLGRTAARRVFSAQEALVLGVLDARARAGERQVDVTAALEVLLRIDFWERDFEPLRRRAYAASGQEALNSVTSKQTFILNETVQTKLKAYAAAMVSRVDGTTRAKLRETLTQAAAGGESTTQVAARVRAVFDVRRSRATAIARTEMLRATEDAQVEGFKQSGVVERKRWNDSQDDRVRDSHLENEIEVVGLDEAFILPNGRSAQFPGDPSLPAEDVVNCRCFVTPEVGE